MASNILPLSFLEAGQDAVIRDFNGGQSLRQRLVDMGFVRGNNVRVVKNEMGGPLIISNGDGRLAIGRGIALKIMVEKGS